jgi:hypothetical protein
MAARHGCLGFAPDDLLVMHEPEAQQSTQDLSGESRRMPNVANLKRGNQFKSMRPIGNRVPGNAGLRVPFGSAPARTG